MATSDQICSTECVKLFVETSVRMHASLDIPTIMREAVLTVLRLMPVQQAAAGLFMQQELAFSERSDGQSWLAMSCRFAAGGWFEKLVDQHGIIHAEATDLNALFKECPELQAFDIESLIVVPVLNAKKERLACMLLFNPTATGLNTQDMMLLEQIALLMASAIESSIKDADNRRVEADLEKSVATYKTLVEQIPAMTYIATLDRSQLLFVSPQVETMLGYSQADFLTAQKTWMQHVHVEDRDRVLVAVEQSVTCGVAFHAEYRIWTKDNKIIWVKDAADVVKDQDQALYFQGVLYDISARKATEQEMLRLAHFDPLTGLANRALFLDRLNQTIAYAKRNDKKFAVLFLDLDGFKAVNDTVGHKVGDDLLIEVAQRLKSAVREVDTVARMGGDEFTIILSETNSQESISRIASKLVKCIALPYQDIAPNHVITVSLGIALYPDDSLNRDELMTLADNAMYKAKHHGKNKFFFHEGF